MTFCGNDFSINFSIALSCICTESFLYHVRETPLAITDSLVLLKIDLFSL